MAEKIPSIEYDAEKEKTLIEKEPTTEQVEEARRFLSEISIVTHDLVGNMEKIIKDVPVYGPVDSRRLGKSLGLNLVDGGFICNFECAYCEYKQEDLNQIASGEKKGIKFRTCEEITKSLNNWLQENPQTHIDSITFAGNTEPLLNKEFAKILSEVLELRDKYRPDTPISLFTNSWHAGEVDLSQIDNAFLKLDAGSQEAFERVNKAKGVKIEGIIEQILKSNAENKVIQTMIVGGKDGNFNEQDIDDYIKALLRIEPEKVGLYSILYASPEKSDIIPVDDDDLMKVAKRIIKAFEKENKKITVEVFKNGEVLGKPRVY